MSLVLPKNATKRESNINIRAREKQKDLIDRAAKVLGKTRSDFMLEAACAKAEDILLDQKVFSLTEEQWEKFNDALDQPVEYNQKLQKLLQTKPLWEA